MNSGRNYWRSMVFIWGAGMGLLIMQSPWHWFLLAMWLLLGILVWLYRRMFVRTINSLAREIGIHNVSDEPLEATHEIAAVARLQTQKAQKSTAHLASHLQNDVFVDPLTHLGNRNFFDARIEVLLQPELNTGAGLLIFLLLQVEQWPEEAQNDVIKQAAVILQNVLRERPDAIIARRLNNEFAVAIHPIKESDVAALCKRLCRGLNRLVLPPETDTHIEQFYFLGATVFSPDVSRYELYSTADLALRTAQLRGNSGWVRLDVDRHLSIRGMVAWRSLFDEVLAKRHFGLLSQPVFNMSDKRVWAHELFAMLWTKEGTPVSATEFVPMALASGYLADIDRLLIDDVVKMLLYDDAAPARVIINVHPASLTKEGFANWLIERLGAQPHVRERLVLEVSYSSLSVYAEKMRPVIDQIKQFGVSVGFDHVGENLVDVSELFDWPVDYIKVHKTVVQDIGQEKNESRILDWMVALNQLCCDKDMALHAEGIECARQWEALKSVGCSAAQGFYLGKPRRLQRLAGERVVAVSQSSS